MQITQEELDRLFPKRRRQGNVSKVIMQTGKTEITQRNTNQFFRILDPDKTQQYIKIIQNSYKNNLELLQQELGNELCAEIVNHFRSWDKALRLSRVENINNKTYDEYTEDDKSVLIDTIFKYAYNQDHTIKFKELEQVEGVGDYKFLQFIFNMGWNSFRQQLDLSMKRKAEFLKMADFDVVQLLKKDVKKYELFSLYKYSFHKPENSYSAIYYYKRFFVQDWNKFIKLILKEQTLYCGVCSININIIK